ncbi:LysM peptidoglycan-binding domain-containing protein [Ectobacillus sp. JY-23]|uniref:LysM peptidoglycan-binding domain-containing protein n=1 Tax=Ectobacillus sp. JY-23 TaxID=2933872 RepID=UPI001FF6DC21|nr:LysM peptidoglycan-binding domain-containing protein [Ectobacillus sp. JY-23]UOY94212.1 LysM peptidoglycan-binding domain-containing protein [Ectobacillus sp. JY-23]
MKKNMLLLFSLLLFIFHTTTAHATESEPRNIYTVKQGDSLAQVAHQYHTSVEIVKAINGLQSDSLVPGQKLWVPVMHITTVEDTLESLSSMYHISPTTIKAVNGLSSNQLYIGQKLKIIPANMTMQGQHILMTKEEFKNWLWHHRFNRRVRIIQQHHTWIPSYQHFNGSNHFRLLQGMENYHIKRNGWKNIAQHITTFPDGKIAVSRSFNIDPEGSIGAQANAGGLAIENVGNFDVDYDVMSTAQKETIIYITALLCIKFGLTPSVESITYHHWWDYDTGERVLDNTKDHEVKTCPGTNFFGGNSTRHALQNFYPLVSNKMQELIRSNE